MPGEPYGDEDGGAWPNGLPEPPELDVDWDAELAELLRQAADGDGWSDTSGSPGDFWADGPPGDDWGPGPSRRRRPPAGVRWAAAIIAASLLIGVVGGTIGVVLDDGPLQQLIGTTVDSVGPAPADSSAEQVVVTVSNESTAPMRPLCTVDVFSPDGTELGQRTSELPYVPAGGRDHWTVDVPVRGHSFAGVRGDAVPLCSIS